MNQMGKIQIGDSDGDGEFTSDDLVQVFQRNGYEDTWVRNSTWAEGDWNGDLEFDTRDFVTAFQDGGYEQAIPTTNGPFVPEPGSATLVGFVVVVFSLLRRGRWRRAVSPTSVPPRSAAASCGAWQA